MPNLTANDLKTRGVAAIESMRKEREQVTALFESRADIKAGRFVKETAAVHVKRMKKSSL